MKPTKNGLDLRKTPVVVIRRLGRQKAYGLSAHPDFSVDKRLHAAIEVDRQTRGANRLKYALHEAAHMACPGLPEETVVRISAVQAKVLKHMGYEGDDDWMDEHLAGCDPNGG